MASMALRRCINCTGSGSGSEHSAIRIVNNSAIWTVNNSLEVQSQVAANSQKVQPPHYHYIWVPWCNSLRQFSVEHSKWLNHSSQSLPWSIAQGYTSCFYYPYPFPSAALSVGRVCCHLILPSLLVFCLHPVIWMYVTIVSLRRKNFPFSNSHISEKSPARSFFQSPCCTSSNVEEPLVMSPMRHPMRMFFIVSASPLSFLLSSCLWGISGPIISVVWSLNLFSS